MANRTTLVDNNTWNNSHIALVGMAMSSTEEKAYPIMRSLGVDYVLVIFGGLIGYSGDDINKFLWMVRIAEGEHPQEIKVSECGLLKVEVTCMLVFCFNLKCRLLLVCNCLLSVLAACAERFVFLSTSRKATISLSRESFVLMQEVLPHCSTVSCISCPTIDSERSR